MGARSLWCCYRFAKRCSQLSQTTFTDAQKAYESIIKREPIEGPKLPEGFNVLVKEFQGLGLKVDLLDHGESADASDVIEKHLAKSKRSMTIV